MTVTTESATPVRWHEPTGLNPRGTLVIVPGRGETAEVYNRFGARLAADAYRVTVIDADSTGELVSRVRELARDEWAVTPLVLVGSDSGALRALAAASTEGLVDAVVVAGLPVDAQAPDTDFETEIAARTGCPTHQGVLRSTGALGYAALPRAITLDELAPAAPAVPVLALHGVTDTISPVERALEYYRALPNATVHLVEDGRHDVLNDATHRSVAATVVLFLERLRLGADLPVIVRGDSAR
ncbi:MAG TPA: lysophospholipase [Nocardia sp.]|uniref:alpha/beta hydrolase n=1 Tax=Nocardia TaxID=1817 RepID=UPI0024577F9B|nr:MULTISPECIES: lysophospholipase [Nocardia]HLS77574.1 lysophospholipase [Nocardia sp.]